MEQLECDSEIKAYIYRLKNYTVGNKTILCDIFIPYHLFHKRRAVQSMIPFTMSHPGPTAKVKLIKFCYFQPDMYNNIRSWTKRCHNCQQSKITHHTKISGSSFLTTLYTIQPVHIDIVGTLPPTINHSSTYSSPARCILSCLDRVTRWVEATHMQDTTATTMAMAFLNVDILIWRSPVCCHR